MDFPELKYPLEDFVEENEVEEARVLEQVRQIIRSRKSEGKTEFLTEFDHMTFDFR